MEQLINFAAAHQTVIMVGVYAYCALMVVVTVLFWGPAAD